MTRRQPLTKFFYTVPETVEATGIGRSRLYEDMRAGVLRRTKVGNRTLIATEDLQSYVEHLRAEGVAA
jgi:excisionase family DNA binding protein